MRLPFQDPPPSRRAVDRYGVLGVLLLMLEVALIFLVWALVAAAEGVRWLWRKINEKTDETQEEGDDEA